MFILKSEGQDSLNREECLKANFTGLPNPTHTTLYTSHYIHTAPTPHLGDPLIIPLSFPPSHRSFLAGPWEGAGMETATHQAKNALTFLHLHLPLPTPRLLTYPSAGVSKARRSGSPLLPPNALTRFSAHPHGGKRSCLSLPVSAPMTHPASLLQGCEERPTRNRRGRPEHN